MEVDMVATGAISHAKGLYVDLQGQAYGRWQKRHVLHRLPTADADARVIGNGRWYY